MKSTQQHIDLDAFIRDPYPTLAVLRRDAPIAYVPELNATATALAGAVSAMASSSVW